MKHIRGIEEEPKVLDPQASFRVDLAEMTATNRLARRKVKMAKWAFIIALVSFTIGLMVGMYYGLTCPRNRVEALAIQRVPELEKQIANLEQDKTLLMKSLFEKEKTVRMTASVR